MVKKISKDVKIIDITGGFFKFFSFLLFIVLLAFLVSSIPTLGFRG